MRADLPPQLHRNINTHAVVVDPVWLAKVYRARVLRIVS
jgi:hypothetical protein